MLSQVGSGWKVKGHRWHLPERQEHWAMKEDGWPSVLGHRMTSGKQKIESILFSEQWMGGSHNVGMSLVRRMAWRK